MKKLLLTLLLLIPVNVFATDLLDFDIKGSWVRTVTEIDGNFTKLSHDENEYILGTDFNVDSNFNQFDYIAIPISLHFYYLYTNSYSQDWTDTDTVSLITATGTSGTTTAPSSYTAGQIACKIQHNYDSTSATVTAMSCNYLGKNYTMTLNNKSHYREHEYDYENILLSYRFFIQYEDNSSYNCSYIDNQYMICPNKQNTKVKRLKVITKNTNSNLFISSTLNGTFMYVNKTSEKYQQQITDIDTSSNSNDFSNTISNFNVPNSSHGFDILGGLQNFVGGLSVSGSCNRLSVPIPFTNQNLVLPCMTTDVYSVHFPEIVIIWQLLVRGIAYYYILVNILKLIKETIDPFNFKLEVMDL